MTYTIDRFEGQFAVVEISIGAFANIPREAIPEEVKEGDIISVTVNKGETDQRKKNISKLMNNLWAD